jgi:hypothetical protein
VGEMVADLAAFNTPPDGSVGLTYYYEPLAEKYLVSFQ